jgi:hypothetical protein
MDLKQVLRQALSRAKSKLFRPSVILRDSDSEADKARALKRYIDKISKIHEQVFTELPGLSQEQHDNEVSRRLKDAGL